MKDHIWPLHNIKRDPETVGSHSHNPVCPLIPAQSWLRTESWHVEDHQRTQSPPGARTKPASRSPQEHHGHVRPRMSPCYPAYVVLAVRVESQPAALAGTRRRLVRVRAGRGTYFIRSHTEHLVTATTILRTPRRSLPGFRGARAFGEVAPSPTCASDTLPWRLSGVP